MAQAGGKNPEKAGEAIEAASWNPGRTDSLKNTQNFVKNFCKIKPKDVDEPRVHDI